MNLFFHASSIPKMDVALTFEDVLLAPVHTSVSSRNLPQLNSKITKNWEIDVPLISANMDTVTEIEMASKMSELGSLGIIHRFMPIKDQVTQVSNLKLKTGNYPVAASIGVKDEGISRLNFLAEAGVDIVAIDIAHGDSKIMLDMISYCKKNFPHIDIIAGNVAMAEAARILIEEGADAIKVGIGPGSMCTTRVVTGCGIPQLTAIAYCAEVCRANSIPLIADGGIKNSGDIVKCFAAGAQTVMLGSIFSGCVETPGEVIDGMKNYRGMASFDAQKHWKGGLNKGTVAEGVSKLVKVKGSAEDVVLDLCGGIKSGMSYLNALSINDIYENSRFVKITNFGSFESKPHGLN
jgi:IMP dehydrogenase